MNDISFLLTLQNQLLPAVYEVGDFMRNAQKSFTTDQIESKGAAGLVSYVDKTAEAMLMKKCSELLPDAGFINEETGVHESDSPYIWIIDPLDGTTNFVHGFPIYSISIGLQHEKELVLGIVYHVPNAEMFTAIKGNGAFLNGQKIKVSDTPDLANSLIASGIARGYTDTATTFIAILREMTTRSHGIRRSGSAAIDLVYVACGRLEGYFENRLSAWDIAGGAVILQEAGGKITDFSGGDNYLFGKELIASNGKVHAEMRGIITQKLGTL
ncbi:MAG: inositol monophosphatase family protein [Bacteroidia bacterium]